jgi:fumarylpyruvate hydrolase
MSLVFAPPDPPSLGVSASAARFPIHRIYCIGRNYAAHAREMGAAVDREHPLFFCKPADAVVTDGMDVPYPPATGDLHHEVEMVVALGRDAAGALTPAEAEDLVFGYTVGLDLTRRDLQAQAKARAHPWDVAKAFDASAPIGRLHASGSGYPRDGTLWLEVNGERRQHADLSAMLWNVGEIVSALSQLFRLRAGDLIFTGTPEGVAALQPGDHFTAGIDAETLLQGRIVTPLA